MNKKNLLLPLIFLLASCAGVTRSCSGCAAKNFGADWIIVQLQMNGEPVSCWTLENVSVTNEESSDGIYWLAENGHLVHLGGWYNRVQVERRGWDSAAKAIGVELARCKDGRYLADKAPE